MNNSYNNDNNNDNNDDNITFFQLYFLLPLEQHPMGLTNGPGCLLLGENS